MDEAYITLIKAKETAFKVYSDALTEALKAKDKAAEDYNKAVKEIQQAYIKTLNQKGSTDHANIKPDFIASS